jgi:hypothetical protein
MIFNSGVLKTYLARFHVFKRSVEILDGIYRNKPVDGELATPVQID